MAVSDAQKKAQAKYDAANMRHYSIKLHKVNDADIIERLDAVENKQDYIKILIRKDIARTSKKYLASGDKV